MVVHPGQRSADFEASCVILWQVYEVPYKSVGLPGARRCMSGLYDPKVRRYARDADAPVVLESRARVLARTLHDLSGLCLMPCSLGSKVGTGSRLVALDAKKGPGDSGGYADPSEYMTPTGTDHFDSNGFGLLDAA